MVVVTRDVTERAQLERAQTDARLAAESANRSKSEFLSRMSHELRTPLNAVLGFAQLMEMGRADRRPGEATTHILRGGRHLLDLINEVLDISRIETGTLALSTEPVLLVDVLAASVDLVRAPWHRARRARGVNAPGRTLHVLADRQRLKQVLLNLLSNAVKYNRPGGSVEVSVEPMTSRTRPGDGGWTPARESPLTNSTAFSPPSIGSMLSRAASKGPGSGWRWRAGSSKRWGVSSA